MKTKIGILYATVDGQTLKICNEIKLELDKYNNEVGLFSIDEFNDKVTNFDKFLVGSSIRYGVHHKKIVDFISKNESDLKAVKNAFFSVNLVARKPEKNTATTNPYVVKFLKKITWKPNIVEVFAGKLDYKKYPFFDRIMIQFIMWITKGPTNKNVEIEYTDWDKVRAFAKTFNQF